MRPQPAARRIAIATIFLVASAASAVASDVEGVRAKFREMDANGDRSLQFVEIQAARAGIFDRMDINGNTVLDPDEISTLEKVAKARSAERQGGLLTGVDFADRAHQLDADGNGAISRAEFIAFLPERLRAADKDGNQALSPRELRALKADASE